MTTRKRPREQTIFFPWERNQSFFGKRGVTRAKPFVAALSMIVVLVLLASRERTRTGIRSTRATLGIVATAVDVYRADHERKCPEELKTLKTEGYLAIDPIDAWGRPLRLICPGRKNPDGYDLMSDGPDGLIGGLDRVE
ncbi:MAG: type II secretion system protein GspG [Polyangiaceae bacterium]|nr:type II secretion system protein GspG [Polyangiaceae bacterium]